MRPISLVFAAFLILTLSQEVEADTTVVSTLEILPGIAATPGGDATEVDYWKFTVLTDGVVTIDILSDSWDADMDGVAHYMDPTISLFVDDGSLDSVDLVAANDDGPPGTDGSRIRYLNTAYDSYLSVFLTAGDYVLSITDCCATDADVLSGINLGSYFPGVSTDGGVTEVWNYQGCVLDCSFADYQIMFIGNIVVEPMRAIVALPDISGNGMPEVGVAVPGSTHVHIRDGSTDALITDINFGDDDALQMAVVPDLNASGNPEIAMLNEQASGQVRVQIRDTLTGAITKNLYYGLAYEPVAMDVIDDYSGNGLPEIAVLGSAAGTDAVRVQVQDTSTGFLDNVFLGTQSIASDLVTVADTSGNGIPEIGILGVLKSSNQVRSQLWDASTASYQANVWFGNKYQPQSMITMPDINMNGSDEIVAMGVDPATDNIRVQVRDSDTTATLFNIWLGAVNEAIDLALINDINNDGVADLAILLKTPAGVGRVRVQSGSNGAFIRNLFYSVVENPVGLAVMPDYNGGGFEELAVLGTSAGVRHVQILDTATGTQVNRIDFP